MSHSLSNGSYLSWGYIGCWIIYKIRSIKASHTQKPLIRPNYQAKKPEFSNHQGIILYDVISYYLFYYDVNFNQPWYHRWLLLRIKFQHPFPIYFEKAVLCIKILYWARLYNWPFYSTNDAVRSMHTKWRWISCLRMLLMPSPTHQGKIMDINQISYFILFENYYSFYNL